MNPNLNNAEKNLLAGLSTTTARCYRKVAADESDPRERKRIEAKAVVYERITTKLIESFNTE